ncbi:DUF6464 family protein [Synechocystis sp. PCC 7509]|uniref:DUF6464 family protein n=1 Tax=Synechocystis sp. PCC 7509 TaxID=927677 RepID=UPI0002ACE781|nr:DUF6464 family protein [Synechocystis sp. PCC 7509]
MEQNLPTEIILTHPRQCLGNVQLDWTPQPGNYLDVGDKTYAVLERRHRYHLRAGRYKLHKIALFVQLAPRPTENSLVDGRWVIGDASCRFNARSEILRCAVNPEGTCQGCRFYEQDQLVTVSALLPPANDSH